MNTYKEKLIKLVLIVHHHSHSLRRRRHHHHRQHHSMNPLAPSSRYLTSFDLSIYT
jgi:hypothetical protein